MNYKVSSKEQIDKINNLIKKYDFDPEKIGNAQDNSYFITLELNLSGKIIQIQNKWEVYRIYTSQVESCVKGAMYTKVHIHCKEFKLELISFEKNLEYQFS